MMLAIMTSVINALVVAMPNDTNCKETSHNDTALMTLVSDYWVLQQWL